METAHQSIGTTTTPLTAMDLRFMTRDGLVALFQRLPAPVFEEMHGEFAATLLEQGTGTASSRPRSHKHRPPPPLPRTLSELHPFILEGPIANFVNRVTQ